VLFSANTGLRPDEARRLQFQDVTILEEDASGQTNLEIEVRRKRGVGYGKSMSGAVRPFERLKARLRPPRANDSRADDAREDGKGRNTIKNGPEEWRLPQPTDLIFPKWQRQLFKTILDEENLRFDREGRREPRTACGIHTSVCA